MSWYIECLKQTLKGQSHQFSACLQKNYQVSIQKDKNWWWFDIMLPKNLPDLSTKFKFNDSQPSCWCEVEKLLVVVSWGIIQGLWILKLKKNSMKFLNTCHYYLNIQNMRFNNNYFLCTIPLIFIFKGRRLCFQLFRLVAAQPQLFCSHHPKTLENNLLYFRLDYEISNCMTRYMIGQLSTWGSWKSKSPTIWNRVAVFCSLKMFILPTW